MFYLNLKPSRNSVLMNISLCLYSNVDASVRKIINVLIPPASLLDTSSHFSFSHLYTHTRMGVKRGSVGAVRWSKRVHVHRLPDRRKVKLRVKLSS